MLIKWFDESRLETLEDVKKQYKALAKKHHPDIGGNTEDTKAINNEYEYLFGRYKNTHKNADGETYRSAEPTTETPLEFIHIVDQLVKMGGVTVELCGSWLWLTGSTREHKDEIKALGFRWSPNKQAWYYHHGAYKKRAKNKYTMSDIRNMFGSEILGADANGNTRLFA